MSNDYSKLKPGDRIRIPEQEREVYDVQEGFIVRFVNREGGTFQLSAVALDDLNAEIIRAKPEMDAGDWDTLERAIDALGDGGYLSTRDNLRTYRDKFRRGK